VVTIKRKLSTDAGGLVLVGLIAAGVFILTLGMLRYGGPQGVYQRIAARLDISAPHPEYVPTPFSAPAGEPEAAALLAVVGPTATPETAPTGAPAGAPVDAVTAAPVQLASARAAQRVDHGGRPVAAVALTFPAAADARLRARYGGAAVAAARMVTQRISGREPAA